MSTLAKKFLYITLFSLSTSLVIALPPFLTGLIIFAQAALEGNLATIGTILPCSESTGLELCRHIKAPTDGAKLTVVEAGAGTGTMTAAIIKHLDSLNVNYELIAVEYLAKPFKELKRKFGNNPRVTLVRGDINNYNPKNRVDHIISSIPFEACTPTMVSSFLQHYQKITKYAGTISYVTYGKWNKLKGMVFKTLCCSKRKRDHDERQRILEDFRRGLINHTTNNKNWPTIDIYHVRNLARA